MLLNIAHPKPAIAVERPTREEAEAAVRTLLRWAGDDPGREGLIDTPGRVVRSYEEFFEGYTIDPVALLEIKVPEVRPVTVEGELGVTSWRPAKVEVPVP